MEFLAMLHFITLSLNSYFPPSVIISFLVIIFLLLCSALMSASEMAFFSLTPIQISDIKEFKTLLSDHRPRSSKH